MKVILVWCWEKIIENSLTLWFSSLGLHAFLLLLSLNESLVMQYKVNNAFMYYEASGKIVQGDDVVLLKEGVDLTATTLWSRPGYTIEKLFSLETYALFIQGAASLVRILWQSAGLAVAKDFPLNQYHRLASSKELHLAAVNKTKIVHTEFFPVPIELLEQRISEICNEKLIVRNPFDNQSIFHFRVIRPQQTDNNPLHRDVWLEDYKDCINLYIPITGSDENSSLIILPESQCWPESKVERTLSGAVINGIRYNVPAVTKIKDEIEYVRPNPGMNQVLVFSPYLIHGGSVNLNADSTRISIEIRLWRK